MTVGDRKRIQILLGKPEGKSPLTRHIGR